MKFLMRYFETNTLMPFAIYCFVGRARLHDLLRRLIAPTGGGLRAVSSFQPKV